MTRLERMALLHAIEKLAPSIILDGDDEDIEEFINNFRGELLQEAYIEGFKAARSMARHRVIYGRTDQMETMGEEKEK